MLLFGSLTHLEFWRLKIESDKAEIMSSLRREGIVPIVLRRRIYESLAPPNSFIAADDFDSPEELAEHLVELAGDKKRYLK